ncbi:MAG: peptidoglycan editing factor PgeF [Desulfobulbaceae bacterium]|jgi:YfiH family protein|nr:peptidoglycan editing factor PgeF [Desulfobulbaceae bacterium]
MNAENKPFAFPGGRCLFANRHGGVSGGLYDSLNIGLHVGDDANLVMENRRRLKTWLGAVRLLSAQQTHGVNIFSLTEPLDDDQEVDDCDALITGQSGVALMIQHADCQAVLLHDPERQIIAAIHNGWRGSAAGILPAVVARLAADWHCRPENLRAWISPSLGPCCGEFIDYRQHLPQEFQCFMPRENHIDFWRISHCQLTEAGLRREHIRLPSICTRCDGDYFSYRRTAAANLTATGRNASLIMLAV